MHNGNNKLGIEGRFITAQVRQLFDDIWQQYTHITRSSITIPSCFYEFAKRYPMPNGELFTGFVAAFADNIFDSTNAKE